MTFGQQLRMYRQARNLSQGGLCALVFPLFRNTTLALDKVALSKIENDRTPPPDFQIVQRLCTAMRISQVERTALYLLERDYEPSRDLKSTQP